jgi:predicted DNA-binding transcriptional regulator YafY
LPLAPPAPLTKHTLGGIEVSFGPRLVGESISVLQTSTRLLELLSLLQSRRDWRGEELADRLQVDRRTVRRDVDRLRRLGYPVKATPGAAGGYRLSAGAALPPLLLDEEEAVAVAVGLRAAAGAGVEGMQETSVRALAKLEQLLPAAARRRVSTLGGATVASVGYGPTVDPQVLVSIATAARDLERLRFSYEDREGQASRRLVEPHRLVHAARRWYLVAWDCERAAWRTFRVDRIVGSLASERRFVPREPPADDLAAYVTESISAIRDRYRAEVVLHAPLKQMATKVPSSVGPLTRIDDRRCLLQVSSSWLGGLAVYIANIGVDFEVREPPELVAQVKVLAERFSRAIRS